MLISNFSHLLMNKPPLGKLLTGHLGAPPTQVSFWLEIEAVKALDAKQPLGPFASNSDSRLVSNAWLP